MTTSRAKSIFQSRTARRSLSPAVILTVDANANLHAIDPRIYGLAFASTSDLSALGRDDESQRRQRHFAV